MFAPRHTGRLLLSASVKTRRMPVECRCVAADAREAVAVDAVTLRGGGLHPRELPALSTPTSGEGDSCSRGEVIVLNLPVTVGGDVHGVAEPSPTLAGDRGWCRCVKDAEKPAIVASVSLCSCYHAAATVATLYSIFFSIFQYFRHICNILPEIRCNIMDFFVKLLHYFATVHFM